MLKNTKQVTYAKIPTAHCNKYFLFNTYHANLCHKKGRNNGHTIVRSPFLFGLFTLMMSAFVQIVRSGFIDNFQKSFHQRSKKKKYSYVLASQWFKTKPVVLFATSVVSFSLSFLLLIFK